MHRPRGLWAWLRWEMSRRIEVDGVIKLIILERFVKGGALLIGGIVLIAAGATTDLHQRANDLQVQLSLEPGRHLLGRLIAWILDRLGSHPDLIGIAAVCYGLLECVEGVGLALRRRWAEYLVVLATGAFLPLEASEVLHRPTPLKVIGFLLNVVIVVYLVWRKRLFMERPGARSAAPAA
jgi:uncharacterized membrane protein (DUF2068 family)